MMGDVATLPWPHSDTSRFLSEYGRNYQVLAPLGLLGYVFEIERHDYPQSLAGHHKVCRQPSQHFAVQRHLEPLLGVNLQLSNVKCVYPLERAPDVKQLV